MNTGTAQIDAGIDELLAVLDEDVHNLQENLLRLDQLRSSVVKRDEAALAKLLEVIQRQSRGQAENGLRRKHVREQLALALGWNVEQVTMSRLETMLPEERRAEIARRKAALRPLAERLKTEYAGAAMLLSDCARFNGLLLKSILGLGGADTTTYSPSGAAGPQSRTAFVNLQL